MCVGIRPVWECLHTHSCIVVCGYLVIDEVSANPRCSVWVSVHARVLSARVALMYLHGAHGSVFCTFVECAGLPGWTEQHRNRCTSIGLQNRMNMKGRRKRIPIKLYISSSWHTTYLEKKNVQKLTFCSASKLSRETLKSNERGREKERERWKACWSARILSRGHQRSDSVFVA